MTKERRSTTTPPAGLSAETRDFWKRTLAEYSFDTSADYALLGELCRTLDRLRGCQARIAADGLMVTGANGQPRPHPLLSTEDACRRSILASARALRLSSPTEL